MPDGRHWTVESDASVPTPTPRSSARCTAGKTSPWSGSGPRPAQGRGHDRQLRHPHPCGAGRAHAAKPAQAGQSRQRQGRPADHGPGHFARSGASSGAGPSSRASSHNSTSASPPAWRPLARLWYTANGGGNGTRLAAARLEALRPKSLPPAQPSRGLFHRAPRALSISAFNGTLHAGEVKRLTSSFAWPSARRPCTAKGAASPRADNPEIHLPLLALATGLHRRQFETARHTCSNACPAAPGGGHPDTARLTMARRPQAETFPNRERRGKPHSIFQIKRRYRP